MLNVHVERILGSYLERERGREERKGYIDVCERGREEERKGGRGGEALTSLCLNSGSSLVTTSANSCTYLLVLRTMCSASSGSNYTL